MMGGGGCLPNSNGNVVRQKVTKSDQKEGGALPKTDGGRGMVQKVMWGKEGLPKSDG